MLLTGPGRCGVITPALWRALAASVVSWSVTVVGVVGVAVVEPVRPASGGAAVAVAADTSGVGQVVMAPVAPDVGQPVRFGAAVVGRVWSWSWIVTGLDDQRVVATSSAAAFTHTFTAFGPYQVRLTVGGPGGTVTRTREFDVTRHRQMGCGEQVTEDTTLTADVVCAAGQAGPALSVSNTGVLLDLGGHRVGGTIFVGTPLYVPERVADVTVRHGGAEALRASFAGFRLADLDRGHLSLYQCTATVTGLRIDAHGRPGAGVGLIWSTVDMTGSTVGNGVLAVAESALNLHGDSMLVDTSVWESSGRASASLTIRDSRLVRSPIVAGGSTNSALLIEHNRISGGDVAIDLPGYPSGLPRIVGNHISGARIGIRIDSGRLFTDVTVAGNTIDHAGAAGILVLHSDDIGFGSVTLTGNHLRANGYHPDGLTESAGRRVTPRWWSAGGANSRDPARDTAPRPSAVTSSVGRAVVCARKRVPVRPFPPPGAVPAAATEARQTE
jgi:PKD repeat protein